MTKTKQQAATRRRSKVVEGFKCASETIGDIKKGMGLFAITRGQFSMIDVVRHCVEQIGPCDVSVWTWCIADYEVEAFEWFLSSKALTGGRLIIDRSAEQRNKELIERWRSTFGTDAVRVVVNHAKIATLQNAEYKILCRGSMNLNFNPRFEQLDITEGGDDFDLVKQIESEIPILDPMCSIAEARTATQLDFAFTMDELKPFETVKVWQK